MAWEDHEELKSHAHRSERYKRTYWSEYSHEELIEVFKRSRNKRDWFSNLRGTEGSYSDEDLLEGFILMDKERRQIRNEESYCRNRSQNSNATGKP